MAIFKRELSWSLTPALAESTGEARQSWFGEAADHGGQQIGDLNRAHLGAVGTVPGEGSQPNRFHVGRFIHPVGMYMLTSLSKAWGRSLPLSWLLIAQLPLQLHCRPRRPRLVSVEAARAGVPIAGGRLAAGFPDQPRHGSPPAGDHHLLPGFHRIEQGGEPVRGLRQIDAGMIR